MTDFVVIGAGIQRSTENFQSTFGGGVEIGAIVERVFGIDIRTRGNQRLGRRDAVFVSSDQ